MAESIVTGPDGNRYRVTHPDGATDQQISAAAQKMAAPAPVQPEGQPFEHDFSAMNMLGNIPSSAATMGKNLWSAASSPIETGEAVGKLVGGGAQMMEQGIQESEWAPDWLKAITFTPVDSMTDEDLTPYAETFIQSVKDRYGSIDKFQRTLEEDPVGAFVDIAGVAAPAMPKVSAALNPINMPKVAGKVAAKVATPQRLPARIYERVAKFGTTLTEEQRAAMINTALKYGLKPSDSGIDEMARIIGSFETKLDDLIKTSTQTGKALPRQSIYKHLGELRQSVAGTFDAPDDLAAINGLVRQFEEYAKAKLPANMTAAELQTMKRGLYTRINWEAKRSTGVPAGEQTRKAVARGAKEGIEQLEPGVKDVNQTLSELYELQPHLQRAANRIGNRRTIPLTAPMEMGAGAGAGYAVAGDVGAGLGGGLGAGAALMAHPRIAPGLAVGLHRLKSKSMIDAILANNPNLSAAELALILSGRTTEESPLLGQ